ncbi:hypothetical protein NKR23_g7194 [Pleurostoma richardsiae]|uniref:Uncharacterized protein n=1 Tax=Pleurostoma richardsiae TaxID=41990 RepID=A0AA38VN25_9PEZI|nr:hypothetical protein NKR23_g7194 [Pleurostoma richardsiae]
MTRLQLLLWLFGAFASTVSAASAPTFCKCTCFTNSTIIEIKPHRDIPSGATTKSAPLLAVEPQSSVAERSPLTKRAGPSLCSQCNRAFCLERYNLPICKGAEEKDVVTMCFQRDSRKDQIIVWAFILGTAGLLGWAAAQRILEAKKIGWPGNSAGVRSPDLFAPPGGRGTLVNAGTSARMGEYRVVGDEDRGDSVGASGTGG